MGEQIAVHAAVARTLAQCGVDTLFGVLGDANLSIAYDLVQEHGSDFVGTAHEAEGVHMADGYARITGRLGVATVTKGPGLTNIVTPLVEASRHGTPLLLVTGDTATDTRSRHQNIEHDLIVQPTGAGFQPLRTVHTAVEDVLLAANRAVSERRPIVLNCPVDLLNRASEFPPINVRPLESMRKQAVAPDPDVIDEATGLVASVRRPIVLAGRGALESNASHALVALAQRLGAPLATTVLAKDLFRGKDLNLGIFGTLATQAGLDVIGESDCVISFGASLNVWTTAQGSLLENKAVVQCDSDPGAILKQAAAHAVDQRSTHHLGVVGDAGLVAAAMLELLEELDFEPSDLRSARLREKLGAHEPEDEFEDLSTGTSVDPRTLAVALNEILPEDRTIVMDAGRFMVAALKYLQVPSPRDLVFPHRFGSIGLSVPTAVGAWHGRRDRPAVAVCGDGGFMLGGLGAFNTAVRHGADLIVVVYNDGGYGAEQSKLLNSRRDPGLALFRWPDLAQLAEGLGGTGLTVRSLDDLAVMRKCLDQRDRPVLVDVKIDMDVAKILHE